jgi:hypothetical protein
MKLAETAGGRQQVATAVANYFIDGASQFVGIDRIRRVNPIAILLGKRRHHGHDALEIVGSNHANLLEWILPDFLIGAGGSQDAIRVAAALKNWACDFLGKNSAEFIFLLFCQRWLTSRRVTRTVNHLLQDMAF